MSELVPRDSFFSVAHEQAPLNLQWLVLRIGGANFLHCWGTDSIWLEHAGFLIRISDTVQSSYNFTNSRVATHFRAWLHAKSCRVPRLVAACPTPCQRVVTHKKLPCATLNSCVSHVHGCSRVVLATRLHL